jgi:hypothetical protein
MNTNKEGLIATFLHGQPAPLSAQYVHILYAFKITRDSTILLLTFGPDHPRKVYKTICNI